MSSGQPTTKPTITNMFVLDVRLPAQIDLESVCSVLREKAREDFESCVFYVSRYLDNYSDLYSILVSYFIYSYLF